MDLFWFFVVVLGSSRVLTKEFWRTNVVPADPHVWSWLGQWLDERGLLALYRGVFFYGVCRMIAWTTWAHVVARPVINGVKHNGYPWDLSWTGPWWVQHVTLPQVTPWVVLPMALILLGSRLLRRERSLGTHGERQYQGDRLAERAPEDLLTRERQHRVDRLDHVVTEDRCRVEIEVAEEVDRAHADRERVRLGDQPHRDQRVLTRTLEQEAGESDAARRRRRPCSHTARTCLWLPRSGTCGVRVRLDPSTASALPSAVPACGHVSPAAPMRSTGIGGPVGDDTGQSRRGHPGQAGLLHLELLVPAVDGESSLARRRR